MGSVWFDGASLSETRQTILIVFMITESSVYSKTKYYSLTIITVSDKLKDPERI